MGFKKKRTQSDTEEKLCELVKVDTSGTEDTQKYQCEPICCPIYFLYFVPVDVQCTFPKFIKL